MNHPTETILYLWTEDKNHKDSLRDVFSLALAMQAQVEIISMYITVPKRFAHYHEKFRIGLEHTIRAQVETVAESMPEAKEKILQNYVLHLRDVKHITHSLLQLLTEKRYFMLIKQATHRGIHAGIDAFEMTLMRKIQCPLWLWRGALLSAEPNPIFVAIDPVHKESKTRALSCSLLQMAHFLAEHFKQKCEIIACYDLGFEKQLRSSAFVSIDERDLEEVLDQERKDAEESIEALMQYSGVSLTKAAIHLKKGYPSDVLPEFLRDKKGMLMLGNVGRSGLSGVVIGNTAETILQRSQQSLLMIKPKNV